MIIAFVRGQALTLPPTHTVGGSRDYLEMQVNFQTADWAGLSKWVHFIPEGGGEEWRLRLEDDKITKARRLNLRAGKYQVYIHGTATDGMRITTDLQPFTVIATGIDSGDDPLGTAPDTPIEDLDRRVTRIEQQGVGPGPDGGQGGPSDAVRYGAPQDLSEKEKEQARKNIGAGSVADLSAQVQRAETAARNAASSQQAAAGNAQTATSAAETATGAASAADGSAQSASTDAGRAEAAQSAASGSAATAQQQAEAAAGSAQDAATQAENASSSATTAQQQAEAAAGSAQTASTAAGNSSTFADASRQNAENAFSSAETAKSEADRAKREADRAAQAGGGTPGGGGVTPEQLQQAVNQALEQAKASGEFDGPPGKDGQPGGPGPAGKDGPAGEDGGHYTPKVSQPDTDHLKFDFTASKPGMPPVGSTQITLPKAEGSGNSGGGGGALAPMQRILDITLPDVSAQTEFVTEEQLKTYHTFYIELNLKEGTSLKGKSVQFILFPKNYGMKATIPWTVYGGNNARLIAVFHFFSGFEYDALRPKTVIVGWTGAGYVEGKPLGITAFAAGAYPQIITMTELPAQTSIKVDVS